MGVTVIDAIGKIVPASWHLLRPLLSRRSCRSERRDADLPDKNDWNAVRVGAWTRVNATCNDSQLAIRLERKEGKGRRLDARLVWKSFVAISPTRGVAFSTWMALGTDLSKRGRCQWPRSSGRLAISGKWSHPYREIMPRRNSIR